MGASGWSYLVLYQPDINKALQELRRKVFEDGDYYKPIEWYKLLYARGILNEKGLNDRLRKLESEPQPKTIQELIQLRGHEGTHSIIDIEGVSSVPGFKIISPLTPLEFTDIFGTDGPTHEMIKQKAEELQVLRDQWQGIYVVVYKNGLPDEIFFTGFSGD